MDANTVRNMLHQQQKRLAKMQKVANRRRMRAHRDPKKKSGKPMWKPKKVTENASLDLSLTVANESETPNE